MSTQDFSVSIEELCANVKDIDVADLAKLNKVVSAELERRVKSGSAVAKKAGGKGAPKGVAPPQFRRPRAWVDFTLDYALNNGWESFMAKNTKEGGAVIEEIMMPESEMVDGAYIYAGSVTDECPSGKQIDMKGAMSLSKAHWCAKDKTGTHPELYDAFLAAFLLKEEAEPSEAAVAAPVEEPKVVRKTAEEKAAEKAAKDAEKAAAKEALKAEKAAAKEALKAEKEALKAAKAEEEKAAKEKAKAEKKAAEDAAKAAAAAPKKANPAKEVTIVAKPVVKVVAAKAAKPAVKAVVAAKAAVAEDPWSCDADGALYEWEFKGKSYLRNHLNQVWREGEDGSEEWCGVYIHARSCIDDSAPEPIDE